MTCSLCTIASDAPARVVFANDYASVVVHDDWATSPHLMIVSARHVENSAELAHDEFRGFFDVFRAAEKTLLTSFSADRVIVMKLGLAVPHLHHHLYPFVRSATREEVMAAIDVRMRNVPDERLQREIIIELARGIRENSGEAHGASDRV